MAIGLDIGSSAVRAVQLEKRRGTFQLTRYGVVTLPPGAVVDGDIADAVSWPALSKSCGARPVSADERSPSGSPALE